MSKRVTSDRTTTVSPIKKVPFILKHTKFSIQYYKLWLFQRIKIVVFTYLELRIISFFLLYLSKVKFQVKLVSAVDHDNANAFLSLPNEFQNCFKKYTHSEVSWLYQKLKLEQWWKALHFLKKKSSLGFKAEKLHCPFQLQLLLRLSRGSYSLALTLPLQSARNTKL